jgi:thioredoxin-disulfide reductase/thioredoxin
MVTLQRSIVIVGSGPAGYTAALYAARAGLSPMIFEGSASAGGALMTTTEVENFPGFPAGVLGPDLMLAMRSQAQRFGAELVRDDVVMLDLDQDIKTVVAAEGTVVETPAVIVATGSTYRQLGLPDEQRLSGHGVSWCATCDGAFFKGADIAVVGGGDSALEEATFLTRFARSVTVIHRRDSLRASQAMQQRALADPKIFFQWNSEAVSLEGDQRLAAVHVRDIGTGEISPLDVTGLFVAIGHEPNSALVEGKLKLDERGYVVVEHPTTATSQPGVFACGDVVDSRYRQAITAAGSGCAASLDAQAYLDARGDIAPRAVMDRGKTLPTSPASSEPEPLLTLLTGRDEEDGADMIAVRDATDESFQSDVLECEQPVLVDFWASWCGPCQLMMPVMDDVAKAYPDDLRVVKVNVDSCPQTAERFDVTSLPALKVFVGGEVVHTIIGAKPKSKLVADLAPWLPGPA